MDLSLIIVTYNSASHITGLLDSIKKSKDKLKKEIIIIDNASADNSADLASKHSLKPTVIRSKSNLGFSKAINQGIKKSTGDYLMLLNPDTRLVGNCLSALYQFAQKTRPLGAVAPRLQDLNGKPQPSVFRFPTLLNAFRQYFLGHKNRFGKYLPPNKTTTVDVAVMAAFLLPRTTIKTVGLLDERFFLYYEDIEFCKRLKKASLPIYYYPAAKVKHAHGASGHFKSHLDSPLLKSAQIYHGETYSNLLNLTLLLGQKWQKITTKSLLNRLSSFNSEN